MIGTEKYIVCRVANVKNVVTGLEGAAIQPIEEELFVSLSEDMDIIIMDAAAVKNIKPLYTENPAMFDNAKPGRTAKFIWKWPTTPITPTVRLH